MRAVRVLWQDAVSVDGWESIDEAKNNRPADITTIGFLIHEDEDYFIIAPSYDHQNDRVASSWCIPKTWVVEIKELEL